jgi:hypothetical protein
LLHTVRHRRPGRQGSRSGAELTRAPGADLPANEAPRPQSSSQPGEKRPAAREQGFDASAAPGFARNRTASLTGRTRIGSDRIVDLRLDGGRIRVHLHPPGRDSGWGIFIDAQQFRTTIEQLCGSPPAGQLRSARLARTARRASPAHPAHRPHPQRRHARKRPRLLRSRRRLL